MNEIKVEKKNGKQEKMKKLEAVEAEKKISYAQIIHRQQQLQNGVHHGKKEKSIFYMENRPKTLGNNLSNGQHAEEKREIIRKETKMGGKNGKQEKTKTIAIEKNAACLWKIDQQRQPTNTTHHGKEEKNNFNKENELKRLKKNLNDNQLAIKETQLKLIEKNRKRVEGNDIIISNIEKVNEKKQKNMKEQMMLKEVEEKKAETYERRDKGRGGK